MTSYTVDLETTRGIISIDIDPTWAPLGADRFRHLISIGFFTDVAFFRVVPGFVAQAGLSGDPKLNKTWREARIKDDPRRESNRRGTVTFATSGPNARTTQFFINLKDNVRLDSMGFAPFGSIQDMTIADALHSGYGDSPPGGTGPMQGRIQREGNVYLRAEFPQLDYIRSASLR